MARKRKAAHRRKSVRRVARPRSRSRRAVYRTNPRKRRSVRRAGARRRSVGRVRRYRRNPGMASGAKGALMGLAFGLGGALGGMALSNIIVTQLAPKIFAPSATDTAQSVAIRNFAIVGAGAVAALMFGKKFAPPQVINAVAIGMMIVPAKNLIYAMAPAGTPFTFLGGSVAMPHFRRPNGVISGSYPGTRRTVGAYPVIGRKNMGAYPQVGAYPTSAQSQPY